MKEGNSWVQNKDLSSLKILGTVEGAIKEPEWNWYNREIGKNNCPIVDTWWQTKQAVFLFHLYLELLNKTRFSNLSFTRNRTGFTWWWWNELVGNNVSGLLAIKSSWPGQMRTIFGDHKRFLDVYFSKFKDIISLEMEPKEMRTDTIG